MISAAAYNLVGMENLDHQNDIVLKSCTIDANFWNIFYLNRFPALRYCKIQNKIYFKCTCVKPILNDERNIVKVQIRLNRSKHDACSLIGKSPYPSICDDMHCLQIKLTYYTKHVECHWAHINKTCV